MVENFFNNFYPTSEPKWQSYCNIIVFINHFGCTAAPFRSLGQDPVQRLIGWHIALFLYHSSRHGYGWRQQSRLSGAVRMVFFNLLIIRKMTNLKLKVSRYAWRRLGQSDLETFAANVVTKTNGIAAYDPIRAQLLALDTINKKFVTALQAALSRDTAAVYQKDLIKQEVYRALDDVALGLELNANGDAMYILNTGMDIYRERSSHEQESLAAPTRLTAENTGNVGEALLIFDYPKSNRTQVETFCVEYSIDGKATWQNGAYGNRTRIILRDLPSRTEIYFRVRALGTFSRKSPWTQSEVGAFIL